MRWDREKLPKPDLHVYGENGAEIMVYNMKRNSKKGDRRKTEKKRGLRNITVKRKNSKLLITLFGLSRGCFLYFARITLLPKHSQPISFSRFILTFSPTLYKFIVWACWP